MCSDVIELQMLDGHTDRVGRHYCAIRYAKQQGITTSN